MKTKHQENEKREKIERSANLVLNRNLSLKLALRYSNMRYLSCRKKLMACLRFFCKLIQEALFENILNQNKLCNLLYKICLLFENCLFKLCCFSIENGRVKYFYSFFELLIFYDKLVIDLLQNTMIDIFNVNEHLCLKENPFHY